MWAGIKTPALVSSTKKDPERNIHPSQRKITNEISTQQKLNCPIRLNGKPIEAFD